MRRVVAAASVVALLCAAIPAHANESVLHQVTYTVTVEAPVTADIYYREVDPPTWADYSHNPYVFSPKATAEVAPGRPWVRSVMLANPDQWAMVSATSGRLPATPMFHCELVVDGAVVATDQGPKGALCALRHW